MGVQNGPSIVRDSSLILELDAADRNSYVGSGTVWNDLSGNNNSGSLVNGVTASNANQGTLLFDGVNDYVDCGNSTTLNIADNVSANIWFNISGYTGVYQGLLAKRVGNTSANYGFNFEEVANLFQWYYNSAGTFRLINVTFSTYFTTNMWYNVCGTFSKNGTSTDGKLYRNGVLIASNTLLNNVASNAATVSIGRSSSTVIEPFKGVIAAVQIYNRALSAAEIQQNYNAQKSRFGLT